MIVQTGRKCCEIGKDKTHTDGSAGVAGGGRADQLF
jgi:hypothetical protein